MQDRKDGAESLQRKMLLVTLIAYRGIVPILQLGKLVQLQNQQTETETEVN